MENLKREYVDLKNVKHRVEHFTLPQQENADREQLVQELFVALAKPGRKIPT